MEQDVIIIGSGPAGCAAAISCIRYGMRVVILGNNRENIGDQSHAASESVHPGITALLHDLDAINCLEAATRGRYNGITHAGVYVPLGADDQGPWSGYHIDRHLFASGLLELALAAGAVLKPEEEATSLITNRDRVAGVATSTGSYHGHYVIDASGYKAFAGRKTGWGFEYESAPLVTWNGRSCHVPADLFPSGTTSTFFIPAPSGWTWLAPEPGGYCSWTRLAGKGKRQLNPPELLSGFPLAGDIRAANRRWRTLATVCSEGLLIVGDAAGVVDPAAGQGVLNALLSGTMAARTMASCRKAPEFEALYLLRYNDWFRSCFKKKLAQLRAFYLQYNLDDLLQK